MATSFLHDPDHSENDPGGEHDQNIQRDVDSDHDGTAKLAKWTTRPPTISAPPAKPLPERRMSSPSPSASKRSAAATCRRARKPSTSPSDGARVLSLAV